LSTEIRGSALDFSVGKFDVDHVMDNFGLRTPPPGPEAFRSTHAVGDGLQWRLGSRTVLENGEWRFGLDGVSAEHTAIITNPNAAVFEIENFNAAERDIFGAYAQWNGQHEQLDFEAGIRVNRVRTDSAEVAASFPAMNPMMQMMAANAAVLAGEFNTADLSRSHTNVDAVIKIGRVLGEMRSVYLELGRKTRAPAYQELYLWLPLPSTGGLADGRSYIGNVSLSSEISAEINIGSNWQWDSAWLTPQVFYKDISGYIQGVPTANTTANQVAMMMTGQPALEFANVDAKVYGADLAWGYYLSDSLVLDGAVTYVRGRRTDVADNLYRLAPLNARIALTYDSDRWSASVETVAYAEQDKVSFYNAEPRTPGYAIVNLSTRWRLGSRWSLTAHAANILDKRYQDHLDGINRVSAVDVPLGQRLYGLGRNVQLGAAIEW
jgi:iron complex outermembrane receptor protein